MAFRDPYDPRGAMRIDRFRDAQRGLTGHCSHPVAEATRARVAAAWILAQMQRLADANRPSSDDTSNSRADGLVVGRPA
jgi:hypothetical protein